MLSAETKHKERRFLYVSSYHSTPHIATSKWVLLPMNFFAARSKKVSMPFSRRRNRGRLTVQQLVASGWGRLRRGRDRDRDRGRVAAALSFRRAKRSGEIRKFHLFKLSLLLDPAGHRQKQIQNKTEDRKALRKSARRTFPI